MRSPCIGCRLELADKNNADCMGCKLPRAYVNGLGPMSENVPIDQTNLTGGGMGKWKKTGDEDKAFVRQALRDRMSTAAMAKILGRNINTIYSIIKKVKADGEIEGGKAGRSEGGENEGQRGLPFGGPQPPPAGESPLDLVFAGHPELYAKLKLLAAAQYRGLEEQVFYLVAREVRTYEEGLGKMPLPFERYFDQARADNFARAHSSPEK